MADPEDSSPGGDERRLDLLPILALVAIAGLLLAGWWVFPWLQKMIFIQDCTASGRTNC